MEYATDNDGLPNRKSKIKAKIDTIMSHIQLFWEMDDCIIDHE